MNILFSSYLFHPSVGGIETVSWILAHEFVNQGHEVQLITCSTGTDPVGLPFKVFRNPSASEILSLLSWCDVYFQNNISLNLSWPLLLRPKPWVVAHHTWIESSSGWLKHFLLRYATNISISQAIADDLSVPSTIIGNPYQGDLFQELPELSKDQDLVFLGRLVPDKGCDLLLQAMKLLQLQSLRPQLTVIGIGPEAERLQVLTEELELTDQVHFVGIQQGMDLVKTLNRHRILVIPSRWREPFGIVALEGIACGCVAVGSEGGGLATAIGSCGVTFPNGDVETLADILAELLSDPDKLSGYRQAAPEHLARHHSSAVAKAYLSVLESSLKKGR